MEVVFGAGGMGFTLMKDALSRALVTRLAPGGAAFRLGVRTGTFVLAVILVHIIEILGEQKPWNACSRLYQSIDSVQPRPQHRRHARTLSKYMFIQNIYLFISIHTAHMIPKILQRLRVYCDVHRPFFPFDPPGRAF